MGITSGSEGTRVRLAGLAATVLVGLLLPQGASAATIYVTNTDDAGPGSLRRAIEHANADPAHDLIRIIGAGTYVTHSALRITSDLTIETPGPPVPFLVRPLAGETDDSIFDIERGDVTIRGLWVGYGSSLRGGGIRFDGGGTLTIDRSYIAGSNGIREIYTTSPDRIVAEAIGGGILVEHGDLVVRRTTLENAAQISIQNSGSGSAFGRARGGSIAMLDGDVTIIDSLVSGQVDASVGFGEQATATAQGGGIYVASGSSLAVRNSTLEDSGVRADGTGPRVYEGGAIWNGGDPAVLTGVTFSNNSVRTTRGADRLGNSVSIYGGAALQNTILSTGPFPFAGTNCESGGATFTSLGHNLEFVANPSEPQGSTCGLNQSTDLVGADPMLGPLLNYGGPTWSLQPQSGSPVIDAGISAGLSSDQRGQPRPFDFPDVTDAVGGDSADIGAYERQAGEGPGNIDQGEFLDQPPQCNGEWATIEAGDSGNGVLHGTPARDVIVGSPQPDLIRSGRGPDLICAGAGDDDVRSGRGRDALSGHAGDDELRGRGGDDAIRGGAGSDELRGDGGHDLCDGGPGTDKLIHC